MPGASERTSSGGWPDDLELRDVRSGGLRNELVVEREERELETVRHAKFVEDVRQVMLDRLLADCEPGCDVDVRKAGDDRRNHFEP